ncbi:tripartite tricarboxylate transporter substrate binding protein [Agrococcus versicolor]|uniref:Tripartite tricarboxylate transporter substrate binding protein n=1 Tax=Agrococcus versicolor TaxID=501482 RepID=A0ABN3AIH9_9MICO
MRKTFALPALSLVAAAALAGCSTGAEDGSDYPSQTINIIVPVPAGSGTDVSTRFVTACLEQELGATIVVENREGGGGAVGIGQYARAAADGYTLISTTVGNALVPPLTEGDVGYDVDTFEPVGLIGQAPVVLVVPADSPFQTAEELFAAAEDERIVVGIPGPLSVPGISMQGLVEESGLQLEAVPFEGNAAVVQALAGGEADAGYLSADGGVTLPRIQSGELRALASAVDEEVESLPDVPTLDSLGYTDLPNGDSFWFLGALDGTPEPVLDRLGEAMETCMTDPEVQSQIGEGVAPPEFVDGTRVDELLHEANDGYVDFLQ